MKLIFESEDCLLGILFGLILIALSEKWFTIPYAKTILMVVIPIFAIIIILDIFHEFTNLGRHFMFIGGALLHNLIDLALCVAFYAMFFNFSLPGIDMIVPYLSQQTIIFWLGIVETVTHLIWLAMAPFNM
jgi:hypothetical protein